MALTVSYSLSSPVNCAIVGSEITPDGDFSYRMTLSLSGYDTLTSVEYSSGLPEILNISGTDLIWDISIDPGETIFSNETFSFTTHDGSGDTYVVDTVAQQPEDTSIFKYTPPDPFEVTIPITFYVEYILALAPMTEYITINQKFVWKPELGLGQLQTAIDNSEY